MGCVGFEGGFDVKRRTVMLSNQNIASRRENVLHEGTNEQNVEWLMSFCVMKEEHS